MKEEDPNIKMKVNFEINMLRKRRIITREDSNDPNNEEQNSGELWVVGPEGVLYHDVHASHHDGHHHLPNWTRVLSAFP